MILADYFQMSVFGFLIFYSGEIADEGGNPITITFSCTMIQP